MKKPMPKYKLKPLILAAATLSIGLSITAPSFADRTGVTPRNTEGCQPEITGQKPASGIYQGLEGVVLLISAPFIEDDAPYAAILSRENISKIFRESIVKNVLPYVRPSGDNCSVPPAFYEFYSTDFQKPEKWAEIDAITDNPKVVTIHIQVSRLRIDEQENRLVAAVIFNISRTGFKSGLSITGLSVLDLSKSQKEISESMSKFADSKYFLTR